MSGTADFPTLYYLQYFRFCTDFNFTYFCYSLKQTAEKFSGCIVRVPGDVMSLNPEQQE